MFRRGGHFFFVPVIPTWGWVLLVVVAATVFFAVLALVLRRRRELKARLTGLNEAQRQTLEEFESQVLALLSQHGGQLSQQQIASVLGLPAELVAEELQEMEAEGQIERRWSTEQYTYAVRRHSG